MHMLKLRSSGASTYMQIYSICRGVAHPFTFSCGETNCLDLPAAAVMKLLTRGRNLQWVGPQKETHHISNSEYQNIGKKALQPVRYAIQSCWFASIVVFVPCEHPWCTDPAEVVCKLRQDLGSCHAVASCDAWIRSKIVCKTLF